MPYYDDISNDDLDYIYGDKADEDSRHGRNVRAAYANQRTYDAPQTFFANPVESDSDDDDLLGIVAALETLEVNDNSSNNNVQPEDNTASEAADDSASLNNGPR